MARRRLKWPYRPRNVALGDNRCPMRRLLQDCVGPQGDVQPGYEQQFRTMFKAQRLGYVDDRFHLTNLGRAFLTTKARA